MSFKNLKRNRKRNAAAIKEALTEKKSSNYQSDERLWYPQLTDGNGYAVIRFMPPAEGNNLPWAKLYKHKFKENNQWFIAECPTTIDKDCPVCTANSELWNTGSEVDKTVARNRKRKIEYYLNVLVEKDSANPENEGKVKIFRCGVKIFKMIQAAQAPEFEDEDPIDPFDFWEGASFKLKIRKVDGNTNYDKSEFDKPAALFDGDDDKLEEVYKQLHNLSDIVAEDKFQSSEKLKERFNRVIGAGAVAGAPKNAEEMVSGKTATVDSDPEVDMDDIPFDTEEDEDAIAMFQRMAEDSDES